MMMYDSLLARSFSKHEQKKLGTGALIICFLIVVSFCTIFQPQWGPLPSSLNLRWPPAVVHKLHLINGTATSLHLGIKSKPDTETMINPDTNNIPTMENHTSSVMQRAPIGLYRKSINRRTNGRTSSSSLSTANNAVKQKILPGRTAAMTCSRGGRSEFCMLEGDIRVDPHSATIYHVVPSNTTTNDAILVNNNNNTSTLTIIRPYGRNGDAAAMGQVREWSVKTIPQSHNDLPRLCSRVHHSPGVLFSMGGFSGNYFHAFTDVLVPLFATSRAFHGQVELLITDHRPWLVSHFTIFFQALSRYNVVDIDKEPQGRKIHCFSRLTLGLKGRHEMELSINPSQSKHTMTDFRKFLRDTYSLRRPTAIKLQAGGDRKLVRPRLVIISRKKTRAFTNVNEIAGMARKLGYKVTVAELDRNMSRSAEIMNSCDVVMGVHGAGLTNMVFLPDNAVLVQVVPVAANFVSKTYFEEPSKDMNVRYLEYKIKREESSLMERYPIDDVVFTSPGSFMKQGWDTFKSIYLDNQNVKLDVPRFRPTLLKALELLHK